MRETPPEIRDEAVYGALGWAYLGLGHLHTIDRAIFPQVVAVAVRHRDLVVARCEHNGLLRRWGPFLAYRRGELHVGRQAQQQERWGIATRTSTTGALLGGVHFR